MDSLLVEGNCMDSLINWIESSMLSVDGNWIASSGSDWLESLFSSLVDGVRLLSCVLLLY